MPATSAASSSGERIRPSRPTAIFGAALLCMRAVLVAKALPIASASAALRVSPTMPRMSYSRRIEAWNWWPFGIMNSPEMVQCKTLEESLQECQGSAQVPEAIPELYSGADDRSGVGGGDLGIRLPAATQRLIESDRR